MYSLTGELSTFVRISQLRTDVHVVDKEVTDAVDALARVREKIGGSICNAAVDNAASKVATLTVQAYAQKFPEEPPILMTRDPGHCIDLVAKDSAKVSCFSELLTTTKTLIRLLTRDRVRAICEEAMRTDRCVFCPVAVLLADTRFYGAADMFKSVLKNQPILNILADLPQFVEYRNTRKTQEREKLDDTLLTLTPLYYRKLQLATNWFDVLKRGNKMTSSESCPMSAYLPIVQAIRNEVNVVLANEGGPSWNTVFGGGKRAELALFITQRFNMDGQDPPGMKVGLLDAYQVWAHMVDPFNRYLEPGLAIKGGGEESDASLSWNDILFRQDGNRREREG